MGLNLATMLRESARSRPAKVALVSGDVHVTYAELDAASDRFAVFTVYALPAVGRALVGGNRRLRSPEATALALLKLCCVDPSRIPPEVVEQHLVLARERHGYLLRRRRPVGTAEGRDHERDGGGSRRRRRLRRRPSP